MLAFGLVEKSLQTEPSSTRDLRKIEPAFPVVAFHHLFAHSPAIRMRLVRCAVTCRKIVSKIWPNPWISQVTQRESPTLFVDSAKFTCEVDLVVWNVQLIPRERT